MQAHPFMIHTPSILNEAKNQIEIGSADNGNYKAAIKSCVSAIESFMNELGALGIGYSKNGYSLQHEMVKLGTELTRMETEHKPIKAKVVAAYESLTGKKMAKGNSKDYQRFSIVVDIRNELSHPKSSIVELTESGLVLTKQGQKLVKKLKSNGFGRNVSDTCDWVLYVNNREFALWCLQATVGIIKLIFGVWPFQNKAQSYIDLYCGDLA